MNEQIAKDEFIKTITTLELLMEINKIDLSNLVFAIHYLICIKSKAGEYSFQDYSDLLDDLKIHAKEAYEREKDLPTQPLC